jgi:hypothetical protein
MRFTGSAIGVVLAVVAALTLAAPVPLDRAAMQLRSPVPLGAELADLNRVSHWPADWVAAVCEPPLYQLQHCDRLPNWTYAAACRSGAEAGGDVEQMIARFAAELPMQVDLHNAGYEWYAFAFDHGSMIDFATVSEVSVQDPVTNLEESPFLRPLRRFGFSTYGTPGPP